MAIYKEKKVYVGFCVVYLIPFLRADFLNADSFFEFLWVDELSF